MLKKIIIIALILFASIFAQGKNKIKKEDLSTKVFGFIEENNKKFIVTEKGMIEITSIDTYQEYYRKIYKDSTIINPNTIISAPQEPLFFLPFQQYQSQLKNKKLENLYLKDFISLDSLNNGKFSYKKIFEYYDKIKN